MDTVFSQNLKLLLTQMNLTSAQLSKAINVDPSLVSRWLRVGCGERKASAHALAIGRYISSRRLSPENAAWLASAVGCQGGQPVTTERIALWLYPGTDLPAAPQDGAHHLPDSNSSPRPPEERAPSHADAVLDVCRDAGAIAALLLAELTAAEPGTNVFVFLSSEAISVAVDKRIVDALKQAAVEQALAFTLLVQSANNSSMSNRLVSAYMPLLVLGKLTLSVVQGTPQTFTATMSVMIPARAVIVTTEAVGKRSAAVATVIREPETVVDMLDNFAATARYARPMMTAYDDSCSRNILEAFFEEYGVPGSLDVIKSGLNPMLLSLKGYGRVLRKLGHTGEQYTWRYQEFARFKSAMDAVLCASRFREVLSLNKLQEVAETGRCRMPSTYFMGAGVWYLDAEDCCDILDGYIRCLEETPNFQVVILDDDSVFVDDSCWHIKNNKHLMIHSWNVEHPVVAYSDQLLLIDEFQRHFEQLWNRIPMGVGSKRAAVETLRGIRGRLHP